MDKSLSPRMARFLFNGGLVMLVISTVLSLINVRAVLATPANASIPVPSDIGFEGYISGASGSNQTVTFKLYNDPTATTPVLWSQTLSNVTISSGLYSVSLTGLNTADLNGTRYLGVTYQGSELTPRIKLSSVPFAINADNANKVGGGDTTGMIAIFETGCPTGWHAYTYAQGRAVVGAAGGASGQSATVGTALGNLETRTHTHTTPAHAHYVSRSGWGSIDVGGSGAYSGYMTTSDGGGKIAGNNTYTGTDGASVSGAGDATMPYIQLYYCQIN